MRIGPEKQHINNFKKITCTVYCNKLTYFNRLGQVAVLPNTALPESWLFIKSNNWFANSQKKFIINAVSFVYGVMAGMAKMMT